MSEVRAHYLTYKYKALTPFLITWKLADLVDGVFMFGEAEEGFTPVGTLVAGMD